MEAAAVKKNNQGANVRRWREWRGINQDVLAEQIGVSQATLSGYEKKEKLEQEILDKISKALDIPVEAITELEQGTAINIISGPFHDSSSAGGINNHPTFNSVDKIVELYERMLKEKDSVIKEKDSVIDLLREIIKEKK